MRHTCSTCRSRAEGVPIDEKPCNSCRVISVNEFSNWKPPKITNSDRIRSTTDEQLAKWLAQSEFNIMDFFAGELQKHAHITVEYPKDEAKLTEEILKWLRAEVTE